MESILAKNIGMDSLAVSLKTHFKIPQTEGKLTVGVIKL